MIGQILSTAGTDTESEGLSSSPLHKDVKSQTFVFSTNCYLEETLSVTISLLLPSQNNITNPTLRACINCDEDVLNCPDVVDNRCFSRHVRFQNQISSFQS
jgi:hypothetical protein